LQEEHPACSSPIMVTTNGKDPTSLVTHYQILVPS
jgi:hypothetical protein